MHKEERDVFKEIEEAYNQMDDKTKQIAMAAATLYVNAFGLRNELNGLIKDRAMMETCGQMSAMLDEAIQAKELASGVFEESTTDEANDTRETRKRHKQLERHLDELVKTIKDKEDELLPRILEFFDEMLDANSYGFVVEDSE